MVLPDSIAGVQVTSGPAQLEIADAPLRRGRPDGPLLIEADHTRASISVAGVGRFVVRDGRHVEALIEDPEQAAGWLHGTVTALLLAQQGRFALHASTVEIDGSALAVTGRRGAGKSTTALQLAKLGHRVLADDVAPLAIQDGEVTHEPTGRPIHVWPDSAQRLEIDIARARPVAAGFDKVSLPVSQTPPVALRTVVLLRRTRAQEAPAHLRSVTVANAAVVLFANAYRVGLLRELWGAQLLEWAARVAERVEVAVVVRPASGWTAAEVARAILQSRAVPSR